VCIDKGQETTKVASLVHQHDVCIDGRPTRPRVISVKQSLLPCHMGQDESKRMDVGSNNSAPICVERVVADDKKLSSSDEGIRWYRDWGSLYGINNLIVNGFLHK
jgi:hypothetical protein